jgi:hypothetical protein
MTNVCFCSALSVTETAGHSLPATPIKRAKLGKEPQPLPAGISNGNGPERDVQFHIFVTNMQLLIPITIDQYSGVK